MTEQAPLERVLFVTGSTMWRVRITKRLKGDYQVIIEDDLKEALRRIKTVQRPYDAVLIDPDGRDVTDVGYLVALARNCGYEGVMLTASDDPETNAELLDFGCSHSARKEEVVKILAESLAQGS